MPDEPQPSRIEKLQAQMREEQARKKARAREKAKPKPGNPNLRKGEMPYNLKPETFQDWCDKNPDYYKKNISFGDVVRLFLHEIPRKYRSVSQKRRIQMVLEALYERALDNKSPLQVAAAQLLMNRAFGKEESSKSDLDAIKKGGLTLVYVDRKQIDPDIPVVQEEQKALAAPEFIDAEFTEDKHGVQ